MFIHSIISQELGCLTGLSTKKLLDNHRPLDFSYWTDLTDSRLDRLLLLIGFVLVLVLG